MHRAGDDLLMAEMHAIEYSQRQMEGLSKASQILKVLTRQHALE
jgi:hypothetical protein